MIITKQIIKTFEREQNIKGTREAIEWLLWVIAEDIMRQSKKENYQIKMTYEKR